MSNRPAIRRLIPLAALIALAGCGDPGGQPYPQLLPLSQLNAPPAVPAHAAKAAADPGAVESSLRARQAAARRHAPASPAADTALTDRAAALRARAGALAATDPAAAAAPMPATETDPETAARAEALRQRARDMLGTAAGEPPPCPPETDDPEAADCAPH